MAFKFDDILFEIFSNLPTKAIFKLAETSKDAHKLPSNDLFVKKQFSNMQSKDDLGFLLQNCFYSMKQKVEIHPLIPEDFNCYGLPSISLQFLSKTAHILASSNGLLFCLYKKDERKVDLFLCNPATQTWVGVPTPVSLHLGGALCKVVLDCNNGESMDYTLMVLMHDPEDEWFSPYVLIKKISPEENAWKEMGKIHRGDRETAFYHMPLYDKSTETLYILSDLYLGINCDRKSQFYWPYITACNMKNFSSQFLKLPKDARNGLYSDDCMMEIFKFWKGDICMIQLSRGVFRVWALLKDGKWGPVLKTGVRALIGKESCLKMGSYIVILGFTVLNGKTLLFATRDEVYCYDLKRREKVAEVICEHEFAACTTVHFHSYSSTLRPLGDGAMQIVQSGV